MSGGSMDYVYRKVEDACGAFQSTNPHREAFKSLLWNVARALRSIEWVDSGDWGPGDEIEAIEACISTADVLAVSIERAEHAALELQMMIDKAKGLQK